MTSNPTYAALFSVLLLLHGCEGFLKAAVGLRIGYSPTEKGYGQPYQSGGLHSKNPALKGQFITGVQGAPKGNEHSPPGSPEGTKLLKHLKILGVNLYLGAPKHSGPHQGPQHGPPIHHNQQQVQHQSHAHQQGLHEGYTEFEAMDAENWIGDAPSPSHQVGTRVYPPANPQMLQSAPSQYPTFSPNDVRSVDDKMRLHYHQQFPSGPPPPPPPNRHPASPHMRGMHWSPRPRLYRIPLMMSPQHSHHMPRTHFPLQRQYSTLFPSHPQMQRASSMTPQFNAPSYPYNQYPYAPPPQHQHHNFMQFPDQGQSSSAAQERQLNGYEGEYALPFPQGGGGDRGHGPPIFNEQAMGMMPEEYRPLQGFQYSHSESSPTVSMGTTSYVDPPIMMEMGGGRGGDDGEQYEPPQSSHQDHQDHRRDNEREAERRRGSATNTQRLLQAPERGSDRISSSAKTQQRPQQEKKRGARDGGSLNKRNFLLEKFKRGTLSDMATQATQLSPVTFGDKVAKNGDENRVGVMRIRRKTTTPTAPTTTSKE